jgi:hypothetical protein
VFVIRFLRFLINIWDREKSPESWLKAIIIPIHKKGNIKHCKNYRGINLLNSDYKIYTNIITNKLYTYYKNELCNEQNGFTTNKNKTLLNINTPT